MRIELQWCHKKEDMLAQTNEPMAISAINKFFAGYNNWFNQNGEYQLPKSGAGIFCTITSKGIEGVDF